NRPAASAKAFETLRRTLGVAGGGFLCAARRGPRIDRAERRGQDDVVRMFVGVDARRSKRGCVSRSIAPARRTKKGALLYAGWHRALGRSICLLVAEFF